MRHAILELALSLSLGSLALSCAAAESRGTAQNSFTQSEGSEPETEVGDPALARDLVMESVRTERRDDRLFVEFNLRNTRPSNLAIEWTIVWLDGRGFRVDTPRHWTPAALGGSGFESISRTAPTPAATGFRLGFRRPNTVR